LAVAMCHHFQVNSVLSKAGKGFNGWDDFIKKNPQRLLKK
jgi:crossover junction endodeoxyribonuclease RuvC